MLFERELSPVSEPGDRREPGRVFFVEAFAPPCLATREMSYERCRPESTTLPPTRAGDRSPRRAGDLHELALVLAGLKLVRKEMTGTGGTEVALEEGRRRGPPAA
jgi:hypothetical protein